MVSFTFLQFSAWGCFPNRGMESQIKAEHSSPGEPKNHKSEFGGSEVAGICKAGH